MTGDGIARKAPRRPANAGLSPPFVGLLTFALCLKLSPGIGLGIFVLSLIVLVDGGSASLLLFGKLIGFMRAVTRMS